MRFKTGVAAAVMLGLPACGHDDHYIVESERTPAVVETQRVVETESVTPTEQQVEVHLSGDEATVVREYFVQYGCPSGLVEIDGRCVAPDVTVKRYSIGQPLPPDVIIVDPPGDLVTRLPALPEDYAYRIVDGDLVVVRKSTLVVLDADELD